MFSNINRPHPFAPLLSKERGWGEVNLIYVLQ